MSTFIVLFVAVMFVLPAFSVIHSTTNAAAYKSQNLSWGVLALNTNKSVYAPNEIAGIALAVLDDAGEMVCDADVSLTITSPTGNATTLSTQDKTLLVTDACPKKELVNEPDFKAQYKIGAETGTYEMSLVATTANGTQEVVDHFEVSKAAFFDVERTAPTRIYPIEVYPIAVEVTPKFDFSGFVIEEVPLDYVITPSDEFIIAKTSSSQKLIWQVNWLKGERYELVYSFDAPDNSPDLHYIGPLRFAANENAKTIIFEEARNWQIAVDAITFVNSTTANADNGNDATLTLSGMSLQQDDLVIIAYAIPDNDGDFDLGLVGASGWTEMADLFSDDSGDANLGVYYKIMGASPDTSVTVDGVGGTDTDTSAVAMAFRGVSTSNPFDVTHVEATGLDTHSPNPGEINHNNPTGVYTVIAGAGMSGNTGAPTITFPTNYTTNAVQQASNDNVDGAVGMGYRTNPADPEDPGTMTLSVSDSLQFAWAAVTMALRPAGITVSGTVYQGNESTPYNCSTDNLTIGVSVNGGSSATGTCTSSDGTWSFTSASAPSADQPVVFYIDSAETPQATTVTVASGSGNISGISLIDDTVVVQHEDSGPVTNSDMSTGDNGNAGIRYAVSGGNLTVESGYELHVLTGDTFTPGGNVTTQGAEGHLHLDDSSTFTGATTQDHVIAGDVLLDTSSTLTAPSTANDGTIKVAGSWTNSSATFTPGSGRVTFTATSGTETIDPGGDAFFDLTMGESSGSATWNLQSALDVNGSLAITYGTLGMNGANNINLADDLTIGANGNYTKSSGTFTFDGTGTSDWSNAATVDDLGTVSINGTTKTIAATSSITATSVNVAASQTLALDGGAYTLTLTGSGTGGSRPFIVSGSLTEGTSSTVTYTGSSATEIEDESYFNLSIHPGGTTSHTTPVGTITVAGDLSVGDGSNTGTMEVNTNDTAITVSGSMTINANGVYSASSNTSNDLEIYDNFTNNGTFTHNSGRVTFSQTSASILAYNANTTFYQLYITTGGKAVQFDNNNQTIITDNGTLSIQGVSCGSKITLDSTVNDDQWDLNVSTTGTTVDIDYADVEDGNSINAITADNSTEANGNNTNWTINNTCSIQISGTVYQANESSVYDCNANNLTIKATINGGAADSGTCTDSGGTWTITTNATPSSDQPVVVYIDSTETPQATTVTVASGSGNISGLNIFDGTVIVRHEDAGPIAISDMSTGDDGDTGVKYEVTGGNVTVDDGFELHVWTGDTFTPGGNVTTQGTGGHLHLDDSSTFTSAGTQDHIISEDVLIDTGATLTAPSTEDSGTLKVGGSWTNSGTFTSGNGLITFTAGSGTETVTTGGNSFYDVAFGFVASSATWNLASALDVNGDLSIDVGTLSMNGSNNINLAGNLIIGIAGNYTKGSGTFTFDSSGTSTWADNNSQDLGIVSINGTSKTVNLDSAVTATSVNVAASQTLGLGSSSYTLTLTGSGTGASRPFIVSGTLNEGTDSTVAYTGTSATEIEDETYYNLAFTPNASVTYTLGTAGSQTIGVSGNLTLGKDDSDAVSVSASTYDAIVDIEENFTVNGAATFTASSSSSFTVGGSWDNDGTFNEGTGTVTLDTATAATLNSGCADEDTCTNENFYNLTLNKSANSNTVTLSGTSLRISNQLNITTGTLVQSSLDIRSQGTTAISIGADGTWSNTSTGDIKLAGNVSNSGSVILKANGSCGGTDDITITAVSGTPSWSGAGQFDFRDVSVTGQDAAVAITVYSGTNGGSNTGSWTFDATCPGGAGLGFTITGWFNPTTSIATKALVVKNNEIRLVTNGSSQPECQTHNGTTWDTAATSSVALSTGSWQHVACSYDKNTIRVYVNGVSTGSQTQVADWENTANSFRIGDDEGGTYGDYSGEIDEVRIYRLGMQPADVTRLYELAPGPVAHWNFDQNTGTSTVYESTDTGYNGTMTGSMTETDWVPGVHGSALEFDGAGDYINVTTGNFVLPSLQGTVSTWVNPTVGGTYDIIGAGTGGSDFRLSPGNNLYGFYISSEYRVSYSTDPTVGAWTYVTLTWDQTNGSILYYNGVQVATNSTPPPAYNQVGIKFATRPDGGGEYLTGKMDDVIVYNYARTSAQILKDMNAGHPVPGSPIGSPVAEWKFDEGYSTTAYDSSANGLNLTLNSASWTPDGKFDKAFNGTGARYASITDDPDLDFTASENFTLSMWVKSDDTANPGGSEYLMDKTTGGVGYSVHFDTSGYPVFTTSSNATTDTATYSTDIYDNAWHHVVAIRTGTTKIELYVDGDLKNTDSSIGTTATLANADTFTIGDQDATDDGDEFFGDIDQVAIYRSALTADQVKVLYNQGKSQAIGATGTTAAGVATSSADRAYCPPGDTTATCKSVGDWKFDENTGTSAFDISGNENTLTLTNSPTYVPGHQGSAINFAGSDAHLVRSAGDDDDFDFAAGESFTLTVWIKHNTASAQEIILAKYAEAGYKLAMESDGDISCMLDYDSTWTPTDSATSAGASLDDNVWHHIACVKNANSTLQLYIDGVLVARDNAISNSTLENSDPLYIGIDSDAASLDWVGQIDNPKIFDYALSPAQISWDFNRGKPRTWFKFDGCSGTTAYEAGVFGFDMTIDPGDASGSNDSVGTCNSGNGDEMWDNGTVGKRNSSLHFDGTNDRAYRVFSGYRGLDSSGSFTMWVKVGTPPSTPYAFFASADTATALYYILVAETTSGTVTIQQRENDTADELSGAIQINDNEWHHIAVVSDGSAYSLYIDGKLDTLTVGQGSNTGDWFSDTSQRDNVTIGYIERDTASNYTLGQIDEVKVFSYPLTQQQVELDYNQGAVFFGPDSGP